MKTIRVWDLPLRLFHWALVGLIVAALVTQKIGGNAMIWHFRCGYAALTLVAFRILWGLVGTRYARFSSFIYRPAHIIAYFHNLRNGSMQRYTGHNPMGGLSVIALLGIVALQALSGLFSNDDIASEGPLVRFISKELSDRISSFHADVSGNLIYALIGLHLAAIAYYYFFKKENLVRPILSGDKEVDYDAPLADDSWKMRALALLILALCGLAVYGTVSLS
jgi:cytochrome b